jgi:hypothetical protein
LSEATQADKDWIGGLTDAAALDEFATLTTRLIGGCAGSALALNLVEKAADLVELPDWDGPVGVLSARPGPQLGMAVQSLGKAGPPPATQERQRGRRRSRLPMLSRKKALIAAGAAVAAIALALVIGWLTARG